MKKQMQSMYSVWMKQTQIRESFGKSRWLRSDKNVTTWGAGEFFPVGFFWVTREVVNCHPIKKVEPNLTNIVPALSALLRASQDHCLLKFVFLLNRLL